MFLTQWIDMFFLAGFDHTKGLMVKKMDPFCSGAKPGHKGDGVYRGRKLPFAYSGDAKSFKKP